MLIYRNNTFLKREKKAAAYAKLNAKTITFDPNLRKPLWKSDEEVEFLWNCSVEEAADKLLNEFGIKLALITCGAEGAWLFNKSAKAFAACPKVSPVDTTGAGDICGGSAVTKLLRLGKDFESLKEAELYETVKFAVTAASLSTEKTGGIPSIPEEDFVVSVSK